MSKADLDALFDAAYRNPKAGINRGGREVGKHRNGKLNAYKNRQRRLEKLARRRTHGYV